MRIIIGANGGLGRALVDYYSQAEPVIAVSRTAPPVSLAAEVTWVQVAGYQPEHLVPLFEVLTEQLAAGQIISGVISAIGLLHTDSYQPEKRLADLNLAQLQHQYQVNAILPLLLLQQLVPYLPRQQPCSFVQLSAKVGSITDNHLGGWYSYRASKAALNMLLKTAAIELRRTHKQLTIAAIHPGTTDTELSKPFQARLTPDKLYSAQLSAQRIAAVIAQLDPQHSGALWHWDGTLLPY